MAHEVVYKCDRDLCLTEIHIKFVLTGAHPGLPADWVEVRWGDYGTKFVFCSWVCADIEVSKYAEAELDHIADTLKEKSAPH